MKSKVVKKILILIIISVMLINLIYVNLGKVFATYGNPTQSTTQPYAPGLQNSNSGMQSNNQQLLPWENPALQQNNQPSADPQDPVEPEEPEETVTEEEEEAISNKTVSQMIKDAVARWYYIMRLIVVAFMLILLIFIGIKMAISTVASEKAVYKQMLVSWVAGMIIVFSIHYIMIVILSINDSIVAALEPLSEATTDIQDESTFGGEENKKTASEIETTLYESARTRAYSLKLTDGFTGMMIYGVLVYYAWRFTLMYFKRVVNIIILTFLAPVVSASYAFNKVMTGKSRVFSTWLSEYIMNVGIQTVHVIMYTSFVHTALELSLVSLPGTILAILLLNFMVKAEGILRKIFKLTAGKGSLAGDMMDRSTFKDLKNDAKGLATAMTGGYIAKHAAKLTYRVATKPVRAFAEKQFGRIMENRANELLVKEEEEEKKRQEEARKGNILLSEKEEKVYNEYQKYRNIKGIDKEAESVAAELAEIQRKLRTEKDAENIKNLMKQLEANEAKHDELDAKEDQIEEEFLKYYHSSGTPLKTFKSNLGKAFDPKYYTEKITESEINRILEIRNMKDSERKELYKKNKIKASEMALFKKYKKLSDDELKKLIGKRRAISTTRIDSEDEIPWRVWSKKTDSIGMRFFNKMKWDTLLGISSAEKKELKNIAKFYKESIMGVIAAIAGLPALANNGLLGIVFLAQAANARGKMLERRGNLRNRPAYKISESYRFKAFSDGAQETIYKEAMKQISYTESMMTKKKRRKFAKKIMNTTVVVARPLVIGSITVSSVCLGLPLDSKTREYDMTPGKPLKPKRLSLTTLEEDRLSGLYEKKLRDDFKVARKRYSYLMTNQLKHLYDEEFEELKEDLDRDVEAKSKEELLKQEALSREDTIIISGEVVTVQSDDEINRFVQSAEQVDNRDDLSRKAKLSIIKSVIQKRETELIEASISRLCIAKGISDVEDLNLTDTDNLEIKKGILGALEKKGVIQKGEIELADEVISSEKIATVHENLVDDENKKKSANTKISERIVQEAILEYMAQKGETNKENLKKDDAKAQIYDIIKERLMSDSSKSSANVINLMNGEDKFKQNMELSDEIKELVEKMPDKVKKRDLVKPKGTPATQEEQEKLMQRLVSREKTRKVNEVKDRMEQALYTGTESTDERELKMLFYLSEMERHNKNAEKVGEKGVAKKKEKTAAEMEYFKRKDGSRRFDSTKDGSRKVDEEEENDDISKVIKDLESKLHGPQDVIEFINKVR